jgi:hypothetical protein
MLTRSGNCYGPIRQDWGTKIKGILQEVDRVQNQLTSESLMCADLLEDVTWKRMEDVEWIITLSKHLRDLEEALRKERGCWTQELLRRIPNLIYDIRGED